MLFTDSDFSQMERPDPRRCVAALLGSSAKSALAVARFLCPTAMFDKAVTIADTPNAVTRASVAGCTVFLVKSSDIRGERYIVIPKKFCSCHYYCQQVIRNRLAWTCKHDLAVQLRVSTLGLCSVPEARDADSRIRRYFANSRSHSCN